MSNTREKYSESQNISLVSQVNRVCPLCQEPLFYQKNNKTHKNYELAHIYPLNPTLFEQKLLEKEPRLSDNVNDEDNLIPLCKICHGQFDNPRTVEEYRKLFTIKKSLIERNTQENIWKKYSIEEEINEIIEAIYNDIQLEGDAKIDFNPKEIDDKLDETITRPTKRKIKNNVTDYYILIRDNFAELDSTKGDLSETISLQIKTYYLKQKGMGFEQQKIFDNIVMWIHTKTSPKTYDAAEILTSFFVQNCEVF
ncbi:MAG: HNH endonuclease [Chloroflexi bacterium]|nr:HNH endonuclease [Chloroflexota bacterium]MBI3173403.1 HNH endonuclease [Chloroflexota bacterium]